MQSDLYSFLLKLIQTCHSLDSKYHPMQTYIRVRICAVNHFILVIVFSLKEIADKFKSQPVVDLARKLDEIEKKLSKTFGITFIGLSQRFSNSDFVLIK